MIAGGGMPVDMTDRVVLVAEDSLLVRALLRSQLREHGCTVVEAADGEQALNRARETSPDVILLDVEMPKMDGFQVLAELKRDPRLDAVPVVFITGRTTADDAVRGLILGAHDYLRKPFEAAELAARIYAAMRTKALQDELRETNAELRRQATVDPLTGLLNRRAADGELTRMCSRSARHHRALAILLVDADDVGSVRRRHGPDGGERFLRDVSERLARRLRREDVLGRWSDHRFVLLGPETDEPGGLALGASLRSAVSAASVRLGDDEIVPTVSVGVAAWRGDLPDELVRRAETALSRATAGGRDRVAAG